MPVNRVDISGTVFSVGVFDTILILFMYILNFYILYHYFMKSKSRNLPKVDTRMVEKFFTNNSNFYAPELRNVKNTK